MSLTRVRLEAARSPNFPEGSKSHGYELVAPLTDDGRIDTSEWSKLKDKCRVTRFWGDATDVEGSLRYVAHGWCFQYETDGADDEPFPNLDVPALSAGAFVSITEGDGIQRPFRVLMMVPWE